jgi:hypothetical protein
MTSLIYSHTDRERKRKAVELLEGKGMNIRKIRLLPASLLLFLSAGLLARAPSGFTGKAPRQDQPQWPKFYALRVVSEKDVLNAKDCLGAPDGRCAEILPGGQLVVLMEKTFIDIGTLVFKGEMDYGLEGWLHVQDTQDERQDYAWIPFWSGRFILSGMWLGGFSFGPGLPGLSLYGGLGVDKIRITNAGTKSLFVDAVIGYRLEAERRWKAVAVLGTAEPALAGVEDARTRLAGLKGT